MTGASDRAKDEHWAVITRVNELLDRLNFELNEQGYGEYTVDQIQCIGVFDVSVLENKLNERYQEVISVKTAVRAECDDKAELDDIDTIAVDIITFVNESEAFE